MENRMRVAVSTEDAKGLESVVSPHFGRCPYYVLVDLDERQVKRVEAVENPYYAAHEPGQVPRFIHSQGADVMLAGGMGRRALGLFQEYRIQAVTGASGTVRYALEQYLQGRLQGAAPCRESIEHAQEDALDEYERDEVGRLREEADMLRQQLDDVTARLNHLS
jgi:predicted Fe-Mo cluster-binding NifX family protein